MTMYKIVFYSTIFGGLAYILINNKCKKKKNLFTHVDLSYRPCTIHHSSSLFLEAALKKDLQALLEINYPIEKVYFCQKRGPPLLKKIDNLILLQKQKIKLGG